MTSIMCPSCKHFIGIIDGKGICFAFNGTENIPQIPEEFLDGTKEHHDPIKNQKNDLVFSEWGK